MPATMILDSKPNERDFVRGVIGADTSEGNLVKAIDSFVISGAIKRFRAAKKKELRYRHHTMLAHASSRVADHETLKDDLILVLKTAAYESKKGRQRLRDLLETDFRSVSKLRGPDLPFPDNFDEFAPFIGECLKAIGEPENAVKISEQRMEGVYAGFQQGEYLENAGGWKQTL